MLVRCVLIFLFLAGAASPAPLEMGAPGDLKKMEVLSSEADPPTPEVEAKKLEAEVEAKKEETKVEAKKEETKVEAEKEETEVEVKKKETKVEAEKDETEVEAEKEEEPLSADRLEIPLPKLSDKPNPDIANVAEKTRDVNPVVTEPVSSADQAKLIDEILSTVDALENAIVEGSSNVDAVEEMKVVNAVVNGVAKLHKPAHVSVSIEEPTVAEIDNTEPQPVEVVAEVDPEAVEGPVIAEVETLDDSNVDPAQEVLPTPVEGTNPPNYTDYDVASQVDEVSATDYPIPEYPSNPEDEIVIGAAKEPEPLPPMVGEPSRPIEENPFEYSAEPDYFSGPENPEPPIAEFSPIPDAPIVAIEEKTDLATSTDQADPTENEVEPNKEGPSIIIFTIRSPISNLYTDGLVPKSIFDLIRYVRNRIMNLPKPKRVTPFEEPNFFVREPSNHERFFEDYPVDDPTAYQEPEPAFQNEPGFPFMDREPMATPFHHAEPMNPFQHGEPINPFHNGEAIHENPFQHSMATLRSKVDQMKKSFRDFQARQRYERQVPYSYFPHYTDY